MVQTGVPFNERGGTLRGCLDLISGRFPRFVFGGRITDDVLPVFHFHDVTRDDLEPKLRYLAENGYRSATSDDIEAFVRGRKIGDRLVGLCFDDAWASVWTVAAPLLRELGFTAIVYAIPARIEEASACRPQRPGNGPVFVTWPELISLHTSGVADVQCHTFSHSRIFCSPDVEGFVTPEYSATPLLNRPQVSRQPALRFLTPDDLGAPLYATRSRMSDGLRIEPDPDARRRAVDHVAREGGAAFFNRAGWRQTLEAVVRDGQAPRVETADEQRATIEEELESGRAILNSRLRTTTVNHICLPWGVSGARTVDALKRLGYRTAFANRLPGLHAVKRGDDPFWLKRLPNKYIFHLPGRGRRIWSAVLRQAQDRPERSRGTAALGDRWR